MLAREELKLASPPLCAGSQEQTVTLTNTAVVTTETSAGKTVATLLNPRLSLSGTGI